MTRVSLVVLDLKSQLGHTTKQLRGEWYLSRQGCLLLGVMGLKFYSQYLSLVCEKEEELFAQTGKRERSLLLVRVYFCP